MSFLEEVKWGVMAAPWAQGGGQKGREGSCLEAEAAREAPGEVGGQEENSAEPLCE